jgi:hypothetical protein
MISFGDFRTAALMYIKYYSPFGEYRVLHYIKNSNSDATMNIGSAIR